eukprot:scaffold48224_cov45-Cyclotella_meneghiniana.AAC.3
MQGAITEEEANRICGLALNCDGSSLSSGEAEFRRKVWLALAPLCEETTSSKDVHNKDCNVSAVCKDEINGITSSAPNTLESSHLKHKEASDGTQSDDTLSKYGDESVTAEGQVTAKRRKVECDVLKRWYDEHESNPYPTKEEKADLMMTTRLTEMQINNWFASERLKKKKTRGDTTAGAVKLSKEAVEKLKKWYDEHEAHAHPTKKERAELALTTELTENQINTWFKCERRRRIKTAGCIFEMKIKTWERFTTAAVSILKKWYDEHESNPYPTKEETAELMMTTRLTEKRIKKWLATERLKKKKAAGDEIKTRERLPIEAVSKLKKWYDDTYEAHPYPSNEEKAKVVMTTGLTKKQVDLWLMRERRARKKDA